jgi:hypothetical protein
VRALVRNVASVTVCAVVLASCGGGGSDSADFTSGYEDVRADLLALGTTVGQAVTSAKGKSDAQLASDFGDYADQAADISSRLEDLDPPSEAESDFGDLKSSFAVVQADLEKIAGAAESHDAQEAYAASASLVADSDDVKSAREAVDKDVNVTE